MPLDPLAQAHIENWINRANEVSKRLQDRGIPTQLMVDRTEDTIRIDVRMGAIAQIALLELLAERLDLACSEGAEA